MSLISVQNFIAPFRNTTHVVTLVLVAALFGAYRYSGGALATVSKRSPLAPRVAPNVHEDAPVIVDEVEDADNDVLKEVMGRSNRKDPNKNAKGEDLKSTLDDVEKKLGLR